MPTKTEEKGLLSMYLKQDESERLVRLRRAIRRRMMIRGEHSLMDHTKDMNLGELKSLARLMT